MRTFGLIGYPLGHSFSQKYFTEKFERENISDATFQNFPLQNINDFPSLVQSKLSLSGLSVTIPYKQKVMAFLDKRDVLATSIGAVNCIKISRNEDGKVKTVGFNTDAYGFEQSLRPLIKPHHDGALILGTGGAALAIKFVLAKIGFKHYFVSRNNIKTDFMPAHLKISGFDIPVFEDKVIGYADINEEILNEYNIIVNSTPAGMFPDENSCPAIPYELLTEKHLLYDLIYNPEETLFLKNGKEQGAQVKNGLEMLQLQAEKAWEIWND